MECFWNYFEHWTALKMEKNFCCIFFILQETSCFIHTHTHSMTHTHGDSQCTYAFRVRLQHFSFEFGIELIFIGSANKLELKKNAAN